MTKIQKLAATLAAAVNDPEFATPLTFGWTATHGDGAYYFGDLVPDNDPHSGDSGTPHAFVKFERTEGDVNAIVTLNVAAIRPTDKWLRDSAFSGMSVEGDVIVNGACYTRRGVDCSSVSLVDDEKHRYGDTAYGDVASMLVGQWARCCATVERRKTMVPVPGLPGGWTVTPEGKAKIAAELKAGKSHHFMPHGFGTGYMVTARPRGRNGRYRFEKDLPIETSRFFGLDVPLVYTTTDCD